MKRYSVDLVDKVVTDLGNLGIHDIDQVGFQTVCDIEKAIIHLIFDSLSFLVRLLCKSPEADIAVGFLLRIL